MSADIVVEGQACKPNISAAGRRLRTRIGYASAVVSIAFLTLAVALHWQWYIRVLVFFPAALAAFGFIQVRRNTCVARAKEGTFEHDDMSRTKADPEDVARSRKVAAGIQRDAVLIAAFAAAIAAATTLIA